MALLWAALQLPFGAVAVGGAPVGGEVTGAVVPYISGTGMSHVSVMETTVAAVPTVLLPENGPRVIHREMSEPPLVALRLSIRAPEAPSLEGAAGVLQELAREWLEDDAVQLGARVELERTASHAVYSIVGPRESFQGMVELLRRAVDRPSLDPARVSAARARVEQRSRALLEVPGLRVRIGLGAELFPGRAGPAAVHLPARLSPADVEWFRSRHFTPANSTVVVVGAVARDEAHSAFSDWPRPPEPARSPPPGAVEREAPAPEVVSTWAGVGWSASDVSPAVLVVAAGLVTERLRAGDLARSRAEVWWGSGRLGLVAVGAAPPGSDGASDPPSEALRRAVSEAANLATPQAVASVRGRLWRRFLYTVRTPQGLATMIGRFHERTGDPGAAARFLSDLSRVDADRVGEALGTILRRTPTVVEVTP